MRDARASRCTRSSEKHDTGFHGTGDLQMRPRRTGRVRPRKPPSDGAPIAVVAVLRLALRTPAPPHVAFFRAPDERLFASKGLTDGVDARNPAPRHARQREPEGRSPARSAAKRERSEAGARRRLRAGVGGSDVNQNVPKPNHASNPRVLPTADASNHA